MATINNSANNSSLFLKDTAKFDISEAGLSKQNPLPPTLQNMGPYSSLELARQANFENLKSYEIEQGSVILENNNNYYVYGPIDFKDDVNISNSQQSAEIFNYVNSAQIAIGEGTVPYELWKKLNNGLAQIPMEGARRSGESIENGATTL
jgi:hypothetical protein